MSSERDLDLGAKTALNRCTVSQDRKQLHRCHVDNDWPTAVSNLYKIFPKEEAEMMAKKFFRIVNVCVSPSSFPLSQILTS